MLNRGIHLAYCTCLASLDGQFTGNSHEHVNGKQVPILQALINREEPDVYSMLHACKGCTVRKPVCCIALQLIEVDPGL